MRLSDTGVCGLARLGKACGAVARLRLPSGSSRIRYPVGKGGGRRGEGGARGEASGRLCLTWKARAGWPPTGPSANRYSGPAPHLGGGRNIPGLAAATRQRTHCRPASRRLGRASIRHCFRRCQPSEVSPGRWPAAACVGESTFIRMHHVSVLMLRDSLKCAALRLTQRVRGLFPSPRPPFLKIAVCLHWASAVLIQPHE